jgi:hypothetical protein
MIRGKWSVIKVGDTNIVSDTEVVTIGGEGQGNY